MTPSFLKRTGPLALVVLLIGGSFAAGVYFGSRATYVLSDSTTTVLRKAEGQPATVDFAPFWKAWNILNEKYVATKQGESASDQDKVWGAIKGLAESYGDPYTTFFPPEDTKQFKEEISGNFEGVGMEVGNRDSALTVISPLKNSPADKAGIRAGDKILKIDDTVAASMQADEAVKLIRGKKGTTVRITVLHKDDKQPKEIKIVRDVINVPTIDTERRPDGIFVIRLYSFTANSAALFRSALQEFVHSRSNKLILDLRGNPGGYLEAAVDMASWFLPDDAVVVKEDTGGHDENSVYRSKGYNVFNKNLKMVILVDGGSASAAEILAGALHEHGVATLVGERTYGKGSVQELINLTPDTALKVTIARWLTPNGNSISEQGLKPDIEVKATREDADKKIDRQLEMAANLLLGK